MVLIDKHNFLSQSAAFWLKTYSTISTLTASSKFLPLLVFLFKGIQNWSHKQLGENLSLLVRFSIFLLIHYITVGLDFKTSVTGFSRKFQEWWICVSNYLGFSHINDPKVYTHLYLHNNKTNTLNKPWVRSLVIFQLPLHLGLNSLLPLQYLWEMPDLSWPSMISHWIFPHLVMNCNWVWVHIS